MKNKLLFFMLGIVLCFGPTTVASAASAALELNCLSEEIHSGDEVEVELLVTTDVTLGDLEGYLTYDDSVIEYVTGPSCIAGGGGMLRIADIGASKTDTTRKYLLRFRAVNQGEAEISFYNTPMVYAYETGLAMSVFSNILSLTVLPPADASTNADLMTLRVNPGKLSPGFSADITEYHVSIPYENESIIISAFAEDAKATVTVRHNTGLLVGENKVQVIVTAESGASKIYDLYVTREEEQIEAEITPPPQTTEKKGVYLQFADKDSVLFSANTDFNVLIKPNGVPAPTGYEEVWITIDGVQVRGFAKREETDREFYILVVEEADGTNAYYRYDSTGQTIQRFSKEEITIKNVIEEDTGTEVLYDAIADYQSRQYVLLLLVTLFASTTAITGILAIRFYLKARESGEELGE